MPDYRVRRSKDTENLPEIIERLADAVAGANPAARRRLLEAATHGQRVLLAYHWYWDDVTNGGHWQYFSNYTGNLWPEALEATRELGLRQEKILRDAIAVFPEKQPGLTQRERQGQLKTIDPAKFDRTDERFHALPGGDEAIRRFIDEHPEEFFVPERSG